MDAAVARNESRAVSRPIKILVPLIQQDIKLGREASEKAGMPYYQAAGEKLLEAKTQMAHGEFKPWIKRTFKVSYETAHVYMKLAAATETSSALHFSSLGDFIRKTGPDPHYNTFASRKPAWQGPVKEVLGRVNVDALRQEDLKRAEARELERKLALQLIDIGFKVLAQKLHPDKQGGSNEAFVRLKAVRERLKQAV